MGWMKPGAPLLETDDVMNRKHCLTLDLEEYFQVSAFDSPARRQQWGSLESRVESNAAKVLGLLAEKKTRATFFVLGWIAQRHPGLVRTIVGEGHEIASHGYAHELVTSQTPQQFREDVRKTKRLLEDLTGAPVNGYRAPSFTVTRETAWALAILVEEGYAYDSSIFPIHHDRYGMPEADPLPHRRETPSGSIWEIPPSTVTIAGVRVPIAGGGYFRIFPYALLRRCLKKVESEAQPLVMYLHPWELDPDQPRMQGPWLSRFRHYINLDKTTGRFAQLLDEFEFGPVSDVFREELEPGRETYAPVLSTVPSPGAQAG